MSVLITAHRDCFEGSGVWSAHDRECFFVALAAEGVCCDTMIQNQLSFLTACAQGQRKTKKCTDKIVPSATKLTAAFTRTWDVWWYLCASIKLEHEIYSLLFSVAKANSAVLFLDRTFQTFCSLDDLRSSCLGAAHIWYSQDIPNSRGTKIAGSSLQLPRICS